MTSLFPSPTVLLFDFGGTLDADGIPWKERFRRLCWEIGIQAEDGRFDQAFYRADDLLVGALPLEATLSETVAQLVDRLGAALGVPSGTLTPVGERFLADSRAHLAENALLLERLSRRYRLGVVSNFYGNLVAICREASLEQCLAVVIDSCVVGLVKPDPRIFRRALEALDSEAGEAIFVGDSRLRDMAGARAAGIPHIWLRGDDNGSAPPCCPGDRVIGRLVQIEQVLA